MSSKETFKENLLSLQVNALGELVMDCGPSEPAWETALLTTPGVMACSPASGEPAVSAQASIWNWRLLLGLADHWSPSPKVNFSHESVLVFIACVHY